MNNDLISREALKEEFDNYIKANPNLSGIFEVGKYIIDNAPTVFDCRSCKNNGNERYCLDCHDYCNFVRYEARPQGKWIYKPTWDNVHKSRTCNKCGYHEVVFPNEADNFCPNCGADMRKGGTE